MEGRSLSKNPLFWWRLRAKPANATRKMKIAGRQSVPKPLHRVSRVINS
jgi:hypothetical protein